MIMANRHARVTSSEASIDKGRQAYADGNHKTAIEHFTLVAHSCSCNRGGRRERCKCKNFDKVARGGGDVFREAMHTCSCDVSRTYNKCHESVHVQALDYRAAVFEKLGKLDLAKRDAEWLLEVAPRSLEGYLRLGKIYRLQKDYEVAFAIWTAGVEVGGREGHGGNAKLKQLYDARAPLQRKFSRRDPIQHFPLEILENIFSHFDTVELSRIHGVCKPWDRFLNSSPRLWRHVQFRAKSAPSVDWLKSLAKKTRGNVQSLNVPDGSRFRLTRKRWHALLQASLRARHVTLGLNRVDENDILLPKKVWESLASVELKQDKANRQGSGLLSDLLLRNADSLENLSVQLASDRISDGFMPLQTFRRLRYLRLEGNEATSGFDWLTLIELALRTPCLEQLHISGCRVNYAPISSPNFPLSEPQPSETSLDSVHSSSIAASIWPRLAVVRLTGATSDATNFNADPSEVAASAFPYLPSLRVFETMDSPWPVSKFRFQGADSPEVRLRDPNHRPVLERCWMETIDSFSRLTAFLEPAVACGALTEVGLPLMDNDGLSGESASHYLRMLGWLRGTESIKTLGLFEFLGEDTGMLSNNDVGDAMVDFIGTFPNLRTLALWSVSYEPRKLAVIAEKVACQGRVGKICVKHLPGALFDQLRDFARDKGVEVVRTLEKRPWPVSLDPKPA